PHPRFFLVLDPTAMHLGDIPDTKERLRLFFGGAVFGARVPSPWPRRLTFLLAPGHEEPAACPLPGREVGRWLALVLLGVAQLKLVGAHDVDAPGDLRFVFPARVEESDSPRLLS